MNKLSFLFPVHQHYRTAALCFFLSVVLQVSVFQGIAFAQQSAVTPAAASAALTQKQMLDGDQRLERPITLDLISVPLDEVLQKESVDKSTDKIEDTNRFLLTAAANCADLKLQVRLDNRPLRTLMGALAEMLPGTWTRTPHGYQISMTKQAAADRTEWWKLFLGEREKALALQQQAVLTAMQAPTPERKDSASDAEESDPAVERNIEKQHEFFQFLPPDLKTQIVTNMDESGFYEVEHMGFGTEGEQTGTIGWLSQMPAQTQETFKAALQDTVNQMTQAPPAYQKYAVKAQQDMAALSLSKVYFLFQNGGFVVFASPYNCPPSVSTTLELHVPLVQSAPTLMLNQAALVKTVQKMGEAAPEEWKRLAAYQLGRVWPNILPTVQPEDPSIWHPSISRAAQTDWLGEKGHMEYVSDYYSHGGYTMPEAQRKLPVKRPLATELDEMAVRRDVSWKKDTAGIYLIRNNRWYRDDDLEVPQPQLRRWFMALLQSRMQEIAARSSVPATGQAVFQTIPQSSEERIAALKQNWDWAAEMFSTLTPWQIRNGLSLFQPEEKDLAALNDASAAKLDEKLKHYFPQGVVLSGSDPFAEATRMPPFHLAVSMLKGFPHTAQFYGSLDDTGRTALLKGTLPASALSPVQIAQAVSLQPLLLQAMQNYPPDTVLLGLVSGESVSNRVVFGSLMSPMRLKAATPAPVASQNTP